MLTGIDCWAQIKPNPVFLVGEAREARVIGVAARRFTVLGHGQLREQ